MQIPDWFQQALTLQFSGQIRARWSPSKHRVLIERKVVRGLEDSKIPPRLLERDPDRLQQIRDGFYPLLELAHGSVTPCSACGADLHIPYKHLGEVRCGACGKVQKASFFPLSDELLSYLRWSDPDRGGTERVLREVEEADSAKQAALKREFKRQHEEIWKEDFRRLFEIPQVGYTGKEFS